MTDSLLTDTLQTAAQVADTTLINKAQEFHVSFDLSRLTDVNIHGNGNSIMFLIVGMGVVFLALFLLYLIFEGIGKGLAWINLIRTKTKKERAGVKSTDLDVSGEVNAAIAMALHLHLNEIHDEENLVLTIRKVARTYSPWNSKIYNLRQLPQKQTYRRQ
ncbi:MAG: OadG family protein [Bacteroidetes bacterium]|nr:OadG family protein [Bacteroidota bacterium]